MGDKHVLENITAGMISIWLLTAWVKREIQTVMTALMGRKPITGAVGINLGSHA